MSTIFESVLPCFNDNNRFVLTTHVNPDGDGLGSEIALAEWLLSQGKNVHIINHSATPEVYHFLDPDQKIIQYEASRDKHLIAEADVIIVLDTNHPDRLRTLKEDVLASSAMIICIDHHLEPDPFAHQYVIDADATSTGEMIYKLLTLTGNDAISPTIARALYCAILTDTGSFRYPRVNPETFHIAAHLVQSGADPVSIYQQVYERWSAGRIQLLGGCLESLKTIYDGRLAHVTITREMLRSTKTLEEDTDNFTIYPMSVEGVVAAIFFLELADGIKMSFRSKGNIPINELAKEFGGNGHLNAAGARLHGSSLVEIKAKVLTSAEKYLLTNR